MNNKYIWSALVIVALVAIGAYWYPSVQSSGLFGSTSCGTITCISGGLRLVTGAGGDFESDVAATFSTTGTAVNGLNWSNNCSLISATFTIPASTTVAMDCALTGAQSSDFVMGGFDTTTLPITGGGWRITGVSASTTAGFDTLQIRNDTGASNIIPASLASTTNVFNLR